jgi:hypothetical protein
MLWLRSKAGGGTGISTPTGNQTTLRLGAFTRLDSAPGKR